MTDGKQDPAGAARRLLSCRQLQVGYRGAALLPPIDLTLLRGQLCAVVGRNGSGKTTFFRTLLGLLAPVAGEMSSAGERLSMAYIPQAHLLDPLVPLRARDVVAMGLDRGLSVLRPLRGEGAARKVDRALAEVGAAGLAEQAFSELSEGQKQRVLMARLVASAPDLAVLDEPTAAMDMVAEKQTMELIDMLRKAFDLTILIVSHHLPVIGRFADQVVFLDRESQAVVSGTPDSVFNDPAFLARYSTAPLEVSGAR